MSNHSSPPVKLVLCDNEGIGRVTVDMEPFFEFSFWMAEELQDLVFQHRHFARAARPGDRIARRQLS
jgi:hypothetical protein